MSIDFDNGLVVGLTLAGKNGLIGIDVSVIYFTSSYEVRWGPNINMGPQTLLATEVSTKLAL